MPIIHGAIFPLFPTFRWPTSCIPNLAAPAALHCPKNDPISTNPPVEGSDPLDTPLESQVPRALLGQPCPRRVLSSVLLEIPGILPQELPGPHILGYPGSAQGPALTAEILGVGTPRDTGEKLSTLVMEAKSPIPGAPCHSFPTIFLDIKPNLAAGLKHFSGSGYFSFFHILIFSFVSRFIPKHNYHAANEISNIFSFQEISLR